MLRLFIAIQLLSSIFTTNLTWLYNTRVDPSCLLTKSDGQKRCYVHKSQYKKPNGLNYALQHLKYNLFSCLVYMEPI